MLQKQIFHAFVERVCSNYPASLPQRGVIVIYCIFGFEPLVVVGRGCDFCSEGEISVLRRSFEKVNILSIVRRHHGQDVTFVIEPHLVNTYLSIKAMNAARQVMAMIDDIVFPVFFQNAVVSRAVYGLVAIGFQDTTLIFVRSHWAYGRRGILHAVSIIMTRAAAVGEIVDTVFLKDIRCLEEIGDFRIRNQLLFNEGLEITVQTGHTTAKTLVDTPSAKIKIRGAIIIHKGLTIQCDGIMNEAVGHEDGISLSQHVFPWAYGRIADTLVKHTRFTVEIAEGAVGGLHHIWSPDHFGGGPVHDDVLPIHEILTHPYLRRSVAIACAVGGGIKVVGIAKLTDGGVGEIAGDKRIARTWCVPVRAFCLLGLERLRQRRSIQGKGDESFQHLLFD